MEVIIVILIMGTLMGIAATQLRQPSAYLYATDLKAMIQQARFESIKRNRKVAVFWNPDSNAFITAVMNNGADVCNKDNTALVLQGHNLSEYTNLHISSNTLLGKGLMWLPTGQSRNCLNGQNTGGEVSFSNKTKIRTLLISNSGKVEIK